MAKPKESTATSIIKKVTDAVASGAAAPYAQRRYADPANPYAGLSYVACEVIWNACGGTKSGLRPRLIDMETNELLIFLIDADGEIIDPTAKGHKKVAYGEGRSFGFIPRPCARTIGFANSLGLPITS